MKTKKIIFIFGCQRSGTTALSEVFKSTPDCKVYLESKEAIHKKAANGNLIRLKAKNQITKIVEKEKEKYIIVKPLVESQKAASIVKSYPNSVGLWLFRTPKDVVKSILVKWGRKNGPSFVKAVVNSEKNWRAELLDKQTVEFVKAIADQSLTPRDYSAVFWYTRNLLFYKQQLYDNPKFSLLSYEMISKEKTYLSKKLESLGLNIEVRPKTFNAKSIGKGKNLKFSPIVERLCDDMYQRLLIDHNNETQDFKFNNKLVK